MDQTFSRKLKTTYESWILQNTDSVRHLETLLKAMLFFLPGRFKDQELTSELVTGGVSIFGLFNDAVWVNKAKELGKFMKSVENEQALGGSTPLPKFPNSLEALAKSDFQLGSTHSTSATTDSAVPISTNDTLSKDSTSKLPEWAKSLQPEIRRQLLSIYQKSPLSLLKNTRLHFLLSFLNEAELLLEIASYELQSRLLYSDYAAKNPTIKKWSSRIRGGTIVLIELIKAILRMILLWRNGGRILFSQSIPSREDAISLASPLDASETETETHDGIPIPNLPALNRDTYRRFTIDNLSGLKQSLTDACPTFQTIMGEILWIVRPLIYLWLKIKYGKVWSPWIVSLLVDLVSQKLSKTAKLSNNEQNEISRRKSLLFLYVFRSPFFENFSQLTKGATNAIYTQISKVGAMQTVWDFLSEILDVYRTRYFYMAGSGSP